MFKGFNITLLLLICLIIFLLLPVADTRVPSGSAWAAGETVQRQWRDTPGGRHPGFVSPAPLAAGALEGNWLLVLNGYARPEVAELDYAGRVVWNYAPIQANSIRRLVNGNTLIADSGAPGPPFVPRVIEVDARGGIVWEYILPGRSRAPQYADRLANGNTLVVTNWEVLEVTPGGNIVWRHGASRNISGLLAGVWAPGLVRAGFAARLGNGHTVIVDRGLSPLVGGRVLEVNQAGEVVWQYGDGRPGTASGQLLEPTAALRLPDGNTLIADLGSARLLQVTAAGEVVRVTGWRDVLNERGAIQTWFALPLPDSSVLVSASFGSGGSGVLLVDDGSVKTYLNGKWLYTEVLPLVVDGYTMVPLRDVFEALGAEVTWDEGSRTVTARRGSRFVSLAIGQSQAFIDGAPVELAIVPRLYANRTMMPLRFVSEALGAKVDWDQATNTVNITNPS